MGCVLWKETPPFIGKNTQKTAKKSQPSTPRIPACHFPHAPPSRHLHTAIETITQRQSRCRRGFQLYHIAAGYRLSTRGTWSRDDVSRWWGKSPLVKFQKHGTKNAGEKKLGSQNWSFVIILLVYSSNKKMVEGEFQEIAHVSSSVPEGRSGSSIDSPSKFGESGRQESIFVGPTLGHPNVAGRFMYSLPIARVFLVSIGSCLPATCSQWTSSRACPNNMI